MLPMGNIHDPGIGRQKRNALRFCQVWVIGRQIAPMGAI